MWNDGAKFFVSFCWLEQKETIMCATIALCTLIICVFVAHKRLGDAGWRCKFLCIIHCVKSVRIGSYPGLLFPHSDWIQKDSVSLRIQSKCGKIRTGINRNTDTFYTVILQGWTERDYDVCNHCTSHIKMIIFNIFLIFYL